MLRLVDVVIADLSVGVGRYVGRRDQDGDADTFVLQDGEEGRLRLARPDLSSPASVVSMAQAAQLYLDDALGKPVPRCPIHRHALDLVAVGRGYGWVCPAGEWHCELGGYAEQAWPHFTEKLLASILSRRLDRRGITGVRSFGVTMEASGPVARFAVADLSPELVAALTDAAAPVPVEVSERLRKPRRAIEPVAEAGEPESSGVVRLVLNTGAVQRGGELGYTIVNDGDVAILTGVGFAVDHREDGWWYSVDTGLSFRAVGLVIKPGQERAMTARIPARAVAGTYRLRKRVRPARARPSASQPNPDDLATELTAEFSVTDQ